MRFNVASKGFRHPKYLFFDKKWDREVNFRPGWFKQWRRTFEARKKIQVNEISVPIAKGYSTVDAVTFVQEKPERWIDPYIWPYQKPFEKKSVDDPNYKPVMGHHYNRHVQLLEGFKGVMNFSNTVMEAEDGLPDQIVELEADITIDEKFIKLLEKRLQFATEGDSVLHKLPNARIWPALHQKTYHNYGSPTDRVESNLLTSFYDVSQLWISANRGLLDRRKVLHPSVVLPFVRENQLITLDLTCNFVTLAQRSGDNYLSPIQTSDKSFDEPSNTLGKNLISVHPCNWEINFEKTHWYPSDWHFKLPEKDQVHTIYLSDSYLRYKKLPDRMAKGRSLMYCYGYAVAQYRNWYGNRADHEDPVNYQVVKNPILVNNVYSNLSKNTIGFTNFQLNTTSFDSEVKNQVWFNGPFNMNEDKELILKKIIAINLFGPYNQPSPLIASETVSNQTSPSTPPPTVN